MTNARTTATALTLRAEAGATITLQHRSSPEALDLAGKPELRRSLTSQPITLSPKLLYDDRGSDLFDKITRLAEYYPTEAEREILADRSEQIAALTQADSIIELGSGTSDKTRTLLDSFHRSGRLKRFTALDVSEATLVSGAEMLAERYRGLDVHALVADFSMTPSDLPAEGHRMIVFLGGTIGNFAPDQRHEFLLSLASGMSSGEWLLLGIDLMKPIDRIMAAYNDDQGITAEFITNALAVLNSRFSADFDLAAFTYAPLWDGREERVDMRLRSTSQQSVSVPGLGVTVDLIAGQEIRVEISSKFRPDKIESELGAADLEMVELWSDEQNDFGLALARRR